MTDDEFLTAFETCGLARHEWTHEAHVRMAWLYVMKRTESGTDVFDRVRTGIKKLNADFVSRHQLDGALKPTREPDPRGLDGYHETVTVAFVTLIAARVLPGEDFSTFSARNPDLLDHTLRALRAHYSPTRLFSPAAKTAFLEPDLRPLPTA